MATADPVIRLGLAISAIRDAGPAGAELRDLCTDQQTPGRIRQVAGRALAALQIRSDDWSAAMATLERHPTVDANKIGAMGFCFGGSVVLDMARVGTDLKGVAAFHAGLGAAGALAQPGRVKARLLVQNGADDPFIKSEAVEAFKKEMDAAKVDYHYISYPGAVHAFTNPEATALGKKFNIPIAYNADADRKSMAEATSFFTAVFK